MNMFSTTEYLVGHTEYEHVIRLGSKYRSKTSSYAIFKEDDMTVFKIPPQLVYYADFYIDKDLSKYATLISIVF